MNPGIPFSSSDEDDPHQFLNKALRLVQEEVALTHSLAEFEALGPFSVYVVWFSKTLQNWKACLSTSLPDGVYYEVTYNGDRQEAYVDTYAKVRNTCRPDDPDRRITSTDQPGGN